MLIAIRTIFALPAFAFAFVAYTAAPALAEKSFQSALHNFVLRQVATGLEYPWGMAFLPDGTLLVTEREGTLRVVDPRTGNVSAPVKGAPKAEAIGQGGMLDVALDPNFTENRLVYLSYSKDVSGGLTTAVSRGRLTANADAFETMETVFEMDPPASGSRHFGSRLVFARDGTLFITLGDRGERDRVQDFSLNRGQVVRINADGSIPSDNPFVNTPGYREETWSHGHRNPQGATLHPETGALWTVEHGARGGDEVNIPRAGKNYGWPIISYGRHYTGFKIGEGQVKDGLEQPVFYWDPSIAPSDADFYTGDTFPNWRGNLFVASLKFTMLSRLTLDGEQVIDEERLIEGEIGRIRDVATGPDGNLYLLTDDDPGGLYQISPQ